MDTLPARIAPEPDPGAPGAGARTPVTGALPEVLAGPPDGVAGQRQRDIH